MAFKLPPIDDTLLAAYAFYAALVLLKTLVLIPLTSYYRITLKVFRSVEDTKAFGGTTADNAQVERVRSIHLNDIENVYVFVFLGAIYLLTGPSAAVALFHFRVFAASRILHTVVYFFGLQPWRFYAFLPGILVNTSMCLQVLAAFC